MIVLTMECAQHLVCVIVMHPTLALIAALQHSFQHAPTTALAEACVKVVTAHVLPHSRVMTALLLPPV